MDCIELRVPQKEIENLKHILNKNKVECQSSSETGFLPPEFIPLILGLSQIAVTALLEYLKSRKQMSEITIVNSDGSEVYLTAENLKKLEIKQNINKRKKTKKR